MLGNRFQLIVKENVWLCTWIKFFNRLDCKYTYIASTNEYEIEKSMQGTTYICVVVFSRFVLHHKVYVYYVVHSIKYNV